MTSVSLAVQMIHISIICGVPLLLPTKPFCVIFCVGMFWLTGVRCRCFVYGCLCHVGVVPGCCVGGVEARSDSTNQNLLQAQHSPPYTQDTETMFAVLYCCLLCSFCGQWSFTLILPRWKILSSWMYKHKCWKVHTLSVSVTHSDCPVSVVASRRGQPGSVGHITYISHGYLFLLSFQVRGKMVVVQK